MRKVVFFSLSIAAVVAPSFAQSATVDDIVAKHIKALGGEEALTSIKNISRSGEATISGSFGEYVGKTKVVIVPRKKAYRRMDIAGEFSETGWNGKVAWSKDSDDPPAVLKGDDEDDIVGEANFDPLVEWGRSKESMLELLGEKSVHGKEHYVLQVQEEIGSPVTTLYVDKKTMMLTRWEFKDDSPDLGDLTIVVTDSDFKKFGAIWINQRSLVQVGDAMSIEYVYTSTEVNADIDESLFELPAK